MSRRSSRTAWALFCLILPAAFMACDRYVDVAAEKDLGLDQDAAPDAFLDASQEEALPPADTFVFNLRGMESGYAVTETSDGNLSAAGVKQAWGDSNNDILVMKLDPAGAVFWKVQIGGDYLEWAGTLVETTDGALITAGITQDALYTSSDSDALVVKIRPDGTVAWQKKLGLSGANFWERFDKALPAEDGGFFLAGSVYAGGSRDAWLVRMDADGAILWQKRYGTEDSEEARGLSLTRDGGFLVAAESRPSGVSLGRTRPWILRLDRDGNILWQRSVSVDLAYPTMFSAREAPDGGILVTATVEDPSTQAWVMRLDNGGAVVFSRLLRTSTGDGYGRDIVIGPGGRIFVTGGGRLTYDANPDPWLMELSADGAIVWQKIVETLCLDLGLQIALSSDLGLLVSSGGCNEAHLVKLTLDGDFNGSCPLLHAWNASAASFPVEVSATAASYQDTDFSPRDAGLTVSDPDLEVEVLCQ